MMSEYIRISTGLNKYKLYPRETLDMEKIIENAGDNDKYYGIFIYEQKHYDKWSKERTLKGVRDVTTDKVVFDFDHQENPEKARRDTLEVIDRLIGDNPELKKEELNIYFSGNRGFHIILTLDRRINRDIYEKIVNKYASDLQTLDPTVKDQQRLIRMPFTKNQKTGLYNIPITYDELNTCSIDEIKDKASIIDEERYGSWVINKHHFRDAFFQFKEEKKEPKLKVSDLDISKKPNWLTTARYALKEGFFEEGERNTACMILAATYKNNGFDSVETYHNLKRTLDKRKTRYNIDYDEDELQGTIIDYVYGRDWKGGQYTEENALLQEISRRLGIENDNDSSSLISFNYGINEFERMAKGWRERLITTGIPDIDKKVMIEKGIMFGFLGAPGCHAKDTGILMFDGSVKKVQDVQVGDYLMGPDSKPREVLKLCRGREEMVKIIPHRNKPFIVNKSHILSLAAGKTRQKAALPGRLNIKVSDYIKGVSGERKTLKSYQLESRGVEFYNNKELPIDPYYLGLWLGDGTSNNCDITTMDESIVNYLNNFCQLNNLNFNRGPKTGKAFTYRITTDIGKSNPLRKNLIALEVLNNKHIPGIYLNSSRDNRLKLLAGLIDTDGYIDANGVGYDIIQKSEVLAEQIVRLARSLGYHASINRTMKSCKYKNEVKTGEYYRVYISGDEKISEIPCLLERKKQVRGITSKNPNMYRFDYELLPEDDFYGFTINKDHLYLTEDFIIHHNSGKTSTALNFSEHLSKEGKHSLFMSLDMPYLSVVGRMVQKEAAKRGHFYSISKIRDIYDNNIENKKLQEVRDYCEKNYSRIIFDNASEANIDHVEKNIEECKQRYGNSFNLVLIDYFEKIRGKYEGDPTTNSAIIASRLSGIAKRYDVAVGVLLQPRKAAGDPRSPLDNYTHIKGSSTIQQDCRVIMTMWRPGYNPQDNNKNDKYASIAVVKANLGEQCQMNFKWDGFSGTLEQMTLDEQKEFKKLLFEIQRKQENEQKRGKRL